MAPDRRMDRLPHVGWNSARHIGVNANQFRGAFDRHHVNHHPTPIAALGDKALVSEALHQHDPGTCDTQGVPAGRGRLARKPVARHVRNHHMESVRCLAAMRRGIGQGIDDLQLLDDRAGPSVRDDERQRVFVLRTNVKEMNVDPIDLGENCGSAFSLASTLRQSYSVAQ